MNYQTLAFSAQGCPAGCLWCVGEDRIPGDFPEMMLGVVEIEHGMRSGLLPLFPLRILELWLAPSSYDKKGAPLEMNYTSHQPICFYLK